jgi:hypothetical protein
MKLVNKTLCLALGLAAFSGAVSADDLIATTARTKGGMHSVGLDYIGTGTGVGMEFVVALPAGATNVDVSGCLKGSGLPSSHSGQCVYNAESNEVIAIAFSPANAPLQGAINLGVVRYKSLQKGKSEATIRGLVVADGKGGTVPSEIQTEDASLGK